MQQNNNLEDKENVKIFLDKEVYKKIFLTLFGLIFITFLFYNQQSIFKFLGILLGIIFPFLLGGAIAFILKIPVNFIEEKIFVKIKNKKFQKFKRPLSLLIALILLFLIFYFLTVLIVPQLVSSFTKLQYSLPKFIENIIIKMREIPLIDNYADNLQKNYNELSWQQIFDQVGGYFNIENIEKTAFSTIYAAASTIMGGVLGSLVTIAIAFVTSLYIVASKERLEYQSKRIIFSITSIPVAKKIIHALHLLHKNFYGFIKGQVLDATFLGVILFVGLLIMKVPNSAMLSVIVGVTDLVPIVGPFVGGAIGFILIVIEDPHKAIMFVIWLVFMQQVESNILYPRLVGESVGLPALWTLVAITVGGSLFGVAGMLLFIPLTSTLYTLIAEYTEYKINKKGLNLKIRK